MSRDAPPVRRRRQGGATVGAWSAAAFVLFLASRAYLLFAFTPDQSDIPWVYEPYVWEHQQAAASGRPLFAFHAEQFERARERAQRAGQPGPAEESHWIEYPPLALRLVLSPTLFLAPLPTPPQDAWPPQGDIEGYARAFRSVLAVVDLAGFVWLLIFVPRLFRNETPREHFERWLAYVVGGHVLGHLLYDRLTLPTGIAVLVATTLLLRARVPALLAFFFLALAVNYQLSPLVLAPIAIAGALSPAAARQPVRRWRDIAIAGALLAGSIAALFAPFYLYEGPASVGLFRFHGARSLQIEAVTATLPLLLSFLGSPVGAAGEYNSWSLVSPLSPLLKAASTPIVALLIAAAAADFVRRARRLTGTVRLAALGGPAFAGFVTASFAAAIAGSKVFSPQYLLWLLPLVAVLPRRRAAWLFVVVAALTTIVFPYAYDHVASWQADPVTREMTAHGPTTLGKLLLAARNLAFVLFTLTVWREARRAIDARAVSLGRVVNAAASRAEGPAATSS